jgi:hypothetical protein
MFALGLTNDRMMVALRASTMDWAGHGRGIHPCAHITHTTTTRQPESRPPPKHRRTCSHSTRAFSSSLRRCGMVWMADTTTSWGKKGRGGGAPGAGPARASSSIWPMLSTTSRLIRRLRSASAPQSHFFGSWRAAAVAAALGNTGWGGGCHVRGADDDMQQARLADKQAGSKCIASRNGRGIPGFDCGIERHSTLTKWCVNAGHSVTAMPLDT